jgi:hypothetical protein
MTRPTTNPTPPQPYRDPTTFHKLRDLIPAATITRALAAGGVATRRVRRLPLALVIWIPIAMALFAELPLDALVARLRLARTPRGAPPVGSGTLAKARARLGAAAERALFEATARRWADRTARTPAVRWCGLALYGVDGTTLPLRDTPALRAAYGGRSGGRGKPSGYPQLKLVAVMALGSRVIRQVAWGACRRAEQALAATLWTALPPRSLTLLDKGFYSTAVFAAWSRGCPSRHWLVRAKRGTRWRKVHAHGPHDWCVELRVTARARRRDPTLPPTLRARAVWVRRRGYRGTWLLTSLLDAAAYPRAALAALYHQRWSQEVAWDELKTHLRPARQPLRSATRAGVAQEVWGLLLAYNLVRRAAAAQAAAAGVAPTAVSFVATLHALRDAWLFWAHGYSLPATLAAYYVVASLLPPRRSGRRYPRAVKVRTTRFPTKPPLRHAREKPDVEAQNAWIEAA